MTVKARDQVTIAIGVDVASVDTYYKLQASTAAAPAKPTTASPSGWSTTEPGYDGTTTNTLYTCQKTTLTDGTFYWGSVNISSSYEAAKQAKNTADSVSTTVTTLNNQFSEFRATQTEFNSTIGTTYTTKTEFNALSVGGRNLLINSSKFNPSEAPYTNSTASEYTTPYGGETSYYCSGSKHVRVNFPTLVSGDEYTLSFSATRANAQDIFVTIGSTTTTLGKTSATSGQWKRFSHTFTAGTDTFAKIRVNNSNDSGQATYVAAFKEFQLEHGNRLTDWVPAPEDIESRMTSAESSISQNANNIALKVSQTDYNGNQIASLINQDATTVQIAASKVEIDGTAVFNSISSSVDNAITSKGYATQTEAQGYASTVNTALSNYITLNDAALQSIQNQVDGQIEAWYKSVDPTTSNEPASTWNTNALKQRHEGDLYYNVENGHSWRWLNSNGTYSWQQIPDSDASAALAAAQNAQTTANSKRRIFTSIPTVPYDIGDLWVSGTQIKYATEGKTSSQSYSFADWIVTATDDSNIPTNVSELNNDANYGTTSQIATAKSEAISSANSTTDTKLQSYSTTTQMNTAIETAVDNLEIGGRNFALNTAGVIVDLTNQPDGSRREYFSFGLGRPLPFGAGTPIVISFDLYMLIKTSGPYLMVYNTNNKGPHQTLGNINVLSGKNLPVGSIVNERIIIETSVAADRSDANLPNDYIEFYSVYGSNNYYRISNLKLEKGNKATGWTPAPEDQTAYVNSAVNSTRSWYATCDTAAATTDKIATIVPETTKFILNVGTVVFVKFSIQNTGAVGSLTLSVNNTDAKNIKYINNNAYANIPDKGYLQANVTYQFVYDGTYWVIQNLNYNTNNIDRIQHSNSLKTASSNATGKSYAVVAGTLIGYISSLSGYQTILDGSIVDISKPILWGTGNVGLNTTFTNSYEVYPSQSLRNQASGWTGTIYNIVYLFGALSGQSLTVDSSIFTDVVPTSEDNKVYIPIGLLYSTYQIAFRSSSDLYAYVDGVFRQVTPSTIVATHRIYYRTATSNNNLTAPAIWVEEATGNTYDAWTTKVPPLAQDTNAGSTKYLYLYTCEQRKRLDGTIQCTKVLLDENTTVIDGGQIITNSITANQLNATNINASGMLTIGSLSTATQSDILNSNEAAERKAVYGTCDTAYDTANKVVTCSGFVLSTGSRIMVKFTTYSTVEAPILNVNSTGAYPVWNNNAVASSSNPVLWSVNSLIPFIFDGDHWCVDAKPPSYVVSCSTSAGTRTKASSLSNTLVVNGTTVAVRFSTANTYTINSVNYNIGDTGGKPIYRNNVTTSSTNTLTWNADTVITLIRQGAVWFLADNGTRTMSEDAAKTATNYITADANGIKVHMSSDATTYQHLTSTTSTWYVSGNKRSEVSGDGLKVYIGNSGSETQVASFGSTTTIGKTAESHLNLDYHSMQMVDKEGDTYFYVSDLRDSSGTYESTETGKFLSSTAEQILTNFSINSVLSFTQTNGNTTTSVNYSLSEGTLIANNPISGATYTLVYKTSSQAVKAFTFGTRAVNTEIGARSVALGDNLEASAIASYAEGYNCISSGWYGHAEGRNTQALAYASHSEGDSTTASLKASHAEGYQSVASGLYSHAQNQGTIASGNSQTTIGKFNTQDGNNTYAVIIGNGTADNARSNALTVDWSGNLTLSGGITLGTTLADSNLPTKGSADTAGTSSATSGATLAVPYITTDAYGRVTAKGTHTHTIDSLAASAIGSGTFAVDRLPTVTRAKGGTGVTEKQTGTMTLNTTNCTQSTAYNQCWHNGIVATVQLGFFTLKAALANGSTIDVGTVPSGFRPAARIFANVAVGNANVSGVISAYIGSDGSISLVNRSGASISTSTVFAITTTYCI